MTKQEIFEIYQYLFDVFGFKEVFVNNKYGYLGKGFCIGLENDLIHLMFLKETEVLHTDVLVGSQLAPFENTDVRGKKYAFRGWFRMFSLIEFLKGEKLYTEVEYKDLSEIEFQTELSLSIKSLIPEITQMFKNEEIVQSWINKYYEFILLKKSNKSKAD